MPEIKNWAEAAVNAVKQYVARAEAALGKRLDELDAKLSGIPAGPKGDKGDAGKDVNKDEITSAIQSAVALHVAALPEAKQGEPGKNGDPGKDAVIDYDRLGEIVKSTVGAAISALPEPKQGDPGKNAVVDYDRIGAAIKDVVSVAIAESPKPSDGKDADPELIVTMMREAVDALPKAVDGKSITVEDVAPLIASEVKNAVGALPRAKDGKDADPETIRSMVFAAVDAIPKPKDGTSVTIDEVRPLVSEAVAKAVAELPKPKDGESIHPDTVALMVRDAVEKAVSALPAAKDGAPGRDASELIPLPSIDESRSYAAGTYAKHNGGEIRAERRTDPVKDGDLLAAGWTVAREGVAAIVFTQGDDPREIECAAMLTSGTKAISAFHVPMMIYREVWKEGDYQQGDVCTWGGSAWHCQQKTTDKPGTSSAWKMMVKEGRAGKDAGAPSPQSRDPVRLK